MRRCVFRDELVENPFPINCKYFTPLIQRADIRICVYEKNTKNVYEICTKNLKNINFHKISTFELGFFVVQFL